ncbi:MAG: hypothetical protein AAF804_22470, partial [Bacteroidota bacterium]
MTSLDFDPNAVASVISGEESDLIPRQFQHIVSSQVDVDRMDYLVRDSHFAGVAIGQFDLYYLINSLTVVSHGTGGVQSLGLTQKGVKAYEGFLLSRQLMNRTLYYHNKVKVLEFMMEEFLREVMRAIKGEEALPPSLEPFVPEYLRLLAEFNGDATSFMQASRKDYLELTEDSIWILARRLVAVQNGPQTATALAKKILTRDLLPHFPIEAGKAELLETTLAENGYAIKRDYAILTLETTLYKEGKKAVFVIDWDGDIKEISKVSAIIGAFKNQPETEKVLVVLDSSKAEAIRDVGIKSQ